MKDRACTSRGEAGFEELPHCGLPCLSVSRTLWDTGVKGWSMLLESVARTLSKAPAGERSSHPRPRGRLCPRNTIRSISRSIDAAFKAFCLFCKLKVYCEILSKLKCPLSYDSYCLFIKFQNCLLLLLPFLPPLPPLAPLSLFLHPCSLNMSSRYPLAPGPLNLVFSFPR